MLVLPGDIPPLLRTKADEVGIFSLNYDVQKFDILN